MKYDSFTLRVPAGELEKVKIAAQENGKTINGYINRLLAGNIAGFVPVDKPPIPTTIDKIEDEETQQVSGTLWLSQFASRTEYL